MKFTFTDQENRARQFKCVLKSQQCEAKSKSGHRCKKRTTIGIPLCWIHLKNDQGLRIKTSSIANAGKGLFTLTEIAKNQPIVPYRGELINEKKLIDRYGNKTAPYAIEIKKGQYIDAACQRGVGALVNHNPKKANARFTNGRNGRINIKSTKKILKNGEIFVNYGKKYKMREKSTHQTK